MSQNDFERLLSFIENTNNKTIIINTPKGGTSFEELIEGFVLDNCIAEHRFHENYESSYTITPKIDYFLKFKNGTICDRRGYVYEESEIKKNESEIIHTHNNLDETYHTIEKYKKNNPKINRYNLYRINGSHEYQKLNPVKYSTGEDVKINDTVTYEDDEKNYMYQITNINLHNYMVEIDLQNLRTKGTLKIYETGPISKLTFKGTYTPSNPSYGPQNMKHFASRGGKSRKSHHRLKRKRLRTRRRHTHRLRQRNR
jgi:hypothetical protein